MPKKNETNETSTPSLDELLEFNDDTASAPVGEAEQVTIEPGVIEVHDAPESFESAEVAALKAELAKAREDLATVLASPTDVSRRPIPESELTAEQKQIRLLQDELARTKGSTVGTLEYEDVADGEGILIHILEDGFGTYYRGQEIVYGPQAYEDTKDRLGISWLNMTDEEQYARWGTLKFRKGPWPGKRQYEEKGLEDKSIRTTAKIIKV